MPSARVTWLLSGWNEAAACLSHFACFGITLDALANIENETADERIKRAERAGYDLSGMRDRLSE